MHIPGARPRPSFLRWAAHSLRRPAGSGVGATRLWLILLLALVGLLATPAQAEVLVSNLGKQADGSARVGILSSSKFSQATGFTTGSNEDGYTLTSVSSLVPA